MSEMIVRIEQALRERGNKRRDLLVYALMQSGCAKQFDSVEVVSFVGAVLNSEKHKQL